MKQWKQLNEINQVNENNQIKYSIQTKRNQRPNILFSLLGLLIISISILSSFNANSTQATQKPTNLYYVSLLRANPGLLQPLIEAVQSHQKLLADEIIIMRHSQGDHWDLMLLSPAPSDFRAAQSFSRWADFQHDFIVSSETPWPLIKTQAKSNGLFHIEMFQAQAGKYAELLKQRKMENDYYQSTNRDGNLIFETLIGSDTDVFTLGFYKDLKHFASMPDLPESRFEEAAKAAGFRSRDDIGLHLRKFLVSHQDTLATPID